MWFYFLGIFIIFAIIIKRIIPHNIAVINDLEHEIKINTIAIKLRNIGIKVLESNKVCSPYAINECINKISNNTLNEVFTYHIPVPIKRESNVISESNSITLNSYITFKERFKKRVHIDGTTMSMSCRLLYDESVSYQRVCIPYEDDRFSLFIVLPRQKMDDCYNLINHKPLEKKHVLLKFPIFKVESTIDLIGPLKELGVTDIDRFIQKVSVEISEDCFIEEDYVVSEKVMVCDRPFIFTIMYKEIPIFIGTISSTE